jgi:dTDP-4-amino-4,6-dideoxygalactose transaminase
MKNHLHDPAVIKLFENTIAEYVGTKYGVSVSSNTDGIFLALKYLIHCGKLKEGTAIDVPNRTFMSVPMSIINANLKIKFKDIQWNGFYRLSPTVIYDSATSFFKNMCVNYPNSIFVISFQYRKSLPIGKGGMIMTNDKKACDYLTRARFNGRNLANKKPKIIGWSMYMTPEQAARGLTLFDSMDLKNSKITNTKYSKGYALYDDISTWKIWNNYKRT